jgi:ribonuclease P protein component
MPPGGGRSFRRVDRLRSSKDFRRVSREGTRVASRSLVLLAAARPARLMPGSSSRLGITVSRRVGPAVVRNRLKRRLREWFRKSRTLIPPGNDFVVIMRPAAASIDSAGLAAELDAAVRRLAAGSTR